MSDRWEYKTVDYKETATFSGSLKVEPLEPLLNEQGRMGWELLSAVPNASVGGRKALILVFKRRL